MSPAVRLSIFGFLLAGFVSGLMVGVIIFGIPAQREIAALDERLRALGVEYEEGK